MVGLILKLRWVAVIIALFSGLHAVAFVAIGIVRGIMGYSLIIQGPPWDGDHAPGIQLARSVDAFLLALVFFVFSIGVLALFLSKQGGSSLESVPEWMRVHELMDYTRAFHPTWDASLAPWSAQPHSPFVREDSPC